MNRANLDLDHHAVRRYAQAADTDELPVKVTQRRTLLGDDKPCIYQRLTQGCRNASRLHREVRDQGFPGDRSVVNSYVRLLEQGRAPGAPARSKAR
ncbi:hypothetical protein ACFRAR_11500 [Kitasatospora sp. NPDC056651]|uniref:hypothetical protein n=1 Tax=Kitasatospora sp. NPDC056651 TaxID=3345892 RepID=UPI0036825D8F